MRTGPRARIALLKASSLRVAHLGSYGRFGTTRASRRAGMDLVRRAIGWTHALGGEVLVVIRAAATARRGTAPPRVYADAYAALVPEAAKAGIRLAIEVIHPLRQDLSFVNTLADARELARRAGPRGGYVLDVWHSGWERAAARRGRRRRAPPDPRRAAERLQGRHDADDGPGAPRRGHPARCAKSYGRSNGTAIAAGTRPRSSPTTSTRWATSARSSTRATRSPA